MRRAAEPAPCGRDWHDGRHRGAGTGSPTSDDAELWSAHESAAPRLVEFVRQRLSQPGLAEGVPPRELEWADDVLDPNALTIGFARRFATYKRATLLLSQPDRLRSAARSTPTGPVQFVFAGKAHPADDRGKEIIRQIVSLRPRPRRCATASCSSRTTTWRSPARSYQGADVWLNTPRRPLEACGHQSA